MKYLVAGKVFAVTHTFKVDYVFIIRDVWTAYVMAAPIYWFIFGFAITRSWLLGFFGGGVSTLTGTALVIFLGLQ